MQSLGQESSELEITSRLLLAKLGGELPAATVIARDIYAHSFVDDTFETRDIFRLAFTLGGFTVHTAHNGTEALQIIRQNATTLDVVIMDFHMPGMSGVQVARDMQERADLATIPVILFTSDVRGKLESELAGLRIARVVFKPCLPDALIAIVKEVVG